MWKRTGGGYGLHLLNRPSGGAAPVADGRVAGSGVTDGWSGMSTTGRRSSLVRTAARGTALHRSESPLWAPVLIGQGARRAARLGAAVVNRHGLTSHEASGHSGGRRAAARVSSGREKEERK